MPKESRAKNYEALDFQYEVLEVKSGAMMRAAWSAVWGPLCGREFINGPPEAAQLNNQVRRRWHALLFGLKAAGWEPARKQSTLTFMRNCPPFAVLSNRLARPCRHARVCPFCWARQVLKVYQRTSQLLLHTIPKTKRPESRLTTFEYKQQFKLDDPNATLLNLARRVRDTRNVELDVLADQGIEPWGSYVLQTVEFSEQRVIVKRRGLIVTTGPCPLAKKRSGLQFEWVQHPNSDNIEKAVARVCRYPIRQFSCDPAQLAGWLNYAESLRLRSSSFRGQLRS